MTTYRNPFIFVNALLGAMLLYATGHLQAEMVVGKNAPSVYAPVTGNGPAIQNLTAQYNSGSIGFADYQAGIARLGHNVNITGTSDEGAATGENTTGIIDPSTPSGADVIPTLSGEGNIIKPQNSSPKLQVQTATNTGVPSCGAGFTSSLLFIAQDPAYALYSGTGISCTQNAYNPYAKATVVTSYTTIIWTPICNPGTACVQGGPITSTSLLQQTVTYDAGGSNVYCNLWVGSQADLSTAQNAAQSDGYTVTYAAAAPGQSSQFQLQFQPTAGASSCPSYSQGQFLSAGNATANPSTAAAQVTGAKPVAGSKLTVAVADPCKDKTYNEERCNDATQCLFRILQNGLCRNLPHGSPELEQCVDQQYLKCLVD